MKKNLLFIFLVLSFKLSAAQSIEYSFDAGINQATFHGPTSAINNPSTTNINSFSKINGYHFGAFVGFDFGPVTIQTGVTYTTKGSSETEAYALNQGPDAAYGSTIIQKETLHYLEIPLNILYNVKIRKTGKFFIGAGPYCAFGVSGRYSNSGTYYNTTIGGFKSGTTAQNGNVNFGNGSSEVNNPDYGLNALVGFSFKDHFIISAGYGFGLTHFTTGIYSNATNTTGNQANEYTNNVLSFSVGYSFL